MKGSLAAIGVLAALTGARLAAAQARDPVSAEALFVEARKAIARGDYAVACPKLAESQRLDPAPGTLLNLADCEEHVGQLASAWQHWRAAIDMLPDSDDRLPTARRRAASLEPRVPRLTVRLAEHAPADAHVERDRVALGPASLGMPLPVNPGAHVVVVTASGHTDQRYEISVSEGEQRELTVEAGADLAAERAPAHAIVPPSATAPPHSSSQSASAAAGSDRAGSTQRTVAFVVGGVGVAALATAVVTGVLVASKQNAVDADCDRSTKLCADQAGVDAASEGKTLLGINTAMWITGVVALGAGAVLFFTSKHHAPKLPPRSAFARPVVTF